MHPFTIVPVIIMWHDASQPRAHAPTPSALSLWPGQRFEAQLQGTEYPAESNCRDNHVKFVLENGLSAQTPVTYPHVPASGLNTNLNAHQSQWQNTSFCVTKSSELATKRCLHISSHTRTVYKWVHRAVNMGHLSFHTSTRQKRTWHRALSLPKNFNRTTSKELWHPDTQEQYNFHPDTTHHKRMYNLPTSYTPNCLYSSPPPNQWPHTYDCPILPFWLYPPNLVPHPLIETYIHKHIPLYETLSP